MGNSFWTYTGQKVDPIRPVNKISKAVSDRVLLAWKAETKEGKHCNRATEKCQ